LHRIGQLCERRSKLNTETQLEKNFHFSGLFGDFVTFLSSSRLGSVTRDMREIFRGFEGL
jgi:hypothetical protein